MNVTEVVATLRSSVGEAWRNASWDGLQAGSMDAAVTGVAVVWAPTLSVLKQAVSQGCNTVLCKDPAFWFDPLERGEKPDSMYLRLPEGAMGMGNMKSIQETEAYRAKKDFLDANKVNVFRISENWDAARQLSTLGLLNALGWKSTDTFVADERFPQTHTAIVSIPAQDLMTVAQHAKSAVAAKAPRLLGDRAAKITRVAVHPGFMTSFAAERIGKTPNLDLILAGEANEWEAFVYCEDWISAGHGKGLLMLGLAPAADASAKEVAAWVRKTLPAAKVSFFPVGDPLQPVKAGALRA